MHADTSKYNEAQAPDERAICRLLADQIERGRPVALLGWDTADKLFKGQVTLATILEFLT